MDALIGYIMQPGADMRIRCVNIEHEATVSKISDEQLFYLMSRGLSDEEARLTAAFGPEFDLWAARTRRWIGRR